MCSVLHRSLPQCFGIKTGVETVLSRIPGGELRERPGYLVVVFRHGTATELGELYRSLAVNCIQKQINRVLVVAGDDDPAGEWSLRDALNVMTLAGVPPDFKLALVATSARVAATYRGAQRDLTAVKIMTRMFDSEEAAVRWLNGVSLS
jgi:hypothetical protein